MNRVVEILMRRDDLTQEQAEELVLDAQEAINDCGGDYNEAESIMYEDLGLEMDYLMDVLYF